MLCDYKISWIKEAPSQALVRFYRGDMALVDGKNTYVRQAKISEKLVDNLAAAKTELTKLAQQKWYEIINEQK